jgi:hypothetical protein
MQKQKQILFRYTWLCMALVFLSSLSLFAQNLYVGGANASDNNPGTAAEPFATIQKAATVATAGDIINIRSGIYRETIVPANSGTSGNPIVFQPDGDAVVTISGADMADGAWTQHEGNIYKKKIEMTDGYNDFMTDNTTLLANQVFVNGEMMIEARWPNVSNPDDLMNRDDFQQIPKDGWMSGGWTTLKDNRIPDIPGGWTGGTIWTMSWYQPVTATIKSSSSGQISFIMRSNDSDFVKEHGDFYYLTGRLGALDTKREFFYDGTYLYLWQPGGGSPENVEVKKRNFAFDLRGKSNITIKNIKIFAATITTDNMSENITLDRLRAQYNSHFVTLPARDVLYSHSDVSGIRLMGPNNVIRNSIVEYSAGHGIVLGGDGGMADNNLIREISYGGTYGCGIFPAPGDKRNTITRNTIYRTGRSGIDMIYANKEIAYNDISGFGLLNTDVGAIYSARGMDLTGTRIHHNWLHSAANDKTHDFPVGAGIYLDQHAKAVTIDHNVFWSNHANDIRIEQGSPPYNMVYNNTMASDVFWASFDTYPDVAPNNSQNNIYRSDIWNHTPQESEITSRTDPLFVEPSAGGLGFRLKPGSPAIDKGIVIEGITGDYQGSAPDAGAYEYGGEEWVPGAVPNLK